MIQPASFHRGDCTSPERKTNPNNNSINSVEVEIPLLAIDGCAPRIDREIRHAPVNQDPLPVELRMKIFEHVVAFDGPLPSDTYYLDLHILAQVCKLWSDIVRCSPSLWRVLSNCGTATALWPTAFTRSASVPLTIYFINRFLTVESILRDYATTLVNSLARWEVVTLHLNAHTELFPPEVTNVAPLLRYLHLRADIGPEFRLNLHETWSPRLRHIKLEGVRLLNWTNSILFGLHTLMLRYKGPPLNELFAILTRCPDLHDLELRDITYRRDSHSRGALQVPLPYLRSLKLMDMNSATTATLLSGIQAPLCHTYFCRCCLLGPPDTEDTRLHEQTRSFLIDRIQHHLPKADGVHILIHPDTMIYVDMYDHMDHSSRIAHIFLDMFTHVEVLRCVHDILDSAQPPLPRAIHLTFISVIPPDVTNFLRSSRRVEWIKFKFPNAAKLCSILHDLLGARNDDSDEVGHDGNGGLDWLFPELRYLIIRGGSDPEVGMALRRVVESRGGDASKVAIAGHGDRPAPLKNVRLSKGYPMDQNVWAGIENILGDGARRIEDY
ncbi:hypothetical protein FRB93_007869 [Tulasnella sp. JGI-2019a]|nr:hypothetical protein FRB93_007869 [Tulasnella sp. JGI-2019a]